MRLQCVKIMGTEDEAILLTEHLTRCQVYSLYECVDAKYYVKVRVNDIEHATNLISNCPTLREFRRIKSSKLEEAG